MAVTKKVKQKKVETFDEIVLQHNAKVIKTGNINGYLVVTAGAKRKRMTVYRHLAFMKRNGEYMPSWFGKQFLKYITKPEEVMRMLNGNNKNCLVEVKVAELSTYKTADIPTWRFIKWGKYRKVDVNEIAKKDPGYAKWLIKKYFEWTLSENTRMKYCFNDLATYILSEEYKKLVEQYGKGISQYFFCYTNGCEALQGKDINLKLCEKFLGKPINYTYDNKTNMFTFFITEKQVLCVSYEPELIGFSNNKQMTCVVYKVSQNSVTFKLMSPKAYEIYLQNVKF